MDRHALQMDVRFSPSVMKTVAICAHYPKYLSHGDVLYSSKQSSMSIGIFEDRLGKYCNGRGIWLCTYRLRHNFHIEMCIPYSDAVHAQRNVQIMKINVAVVKGVQKKQSARISATKDVLTLSRMEEFVQKWCKAIYLQS